MWIFSYNSVKYFITCLSISNYADLNYTTYIKLQAFNNTITVCTGVYIAFCYMNTLQMSTISTEISWIKFHYTCIYKNNKLNLLLQHEQIIHKVCNFRIYIFICLLRNKWQNLYNLCIMYKSAVTFLFNKLL